MEKQRLIDLTKTYINNNFYMVAEKINRAVNSGCIDIDSIKEDDYTVIKALAFAAIKDFANDLKPLTSEGIKEANNISKFI